EFDQHAAASGAPVVVVGIELSARRARVRARIRLEYLGGLGIDNHDAVARPGAAAEKAAGLADGAAIGACELPGRVARHHLAGERLDLADLLVARAPDEAVRIERHVADRRRVHLLGDLPGDALEVLGLGIEAIDVVAPVL